MAASKRLRTAVHGQPVPGVTGVANRLAGRVLAGNPGTGDVRGRLDSRTISLQGPTAADTFKLRVRFQNPNRAANTEFDAVSNHDSYTDTADITVGTNCSVANIQSELRTATGDSALIVTPGPSDDVGPWVVNPGSATTLGPERQSYELQAVDCVGVSVSIDSGPVTYVSSKGLPGEVHRHGTDTGVTTASSPGRQAGMDVPLGYSTVTDGIGQTAQTTLVAPTVASAVGGDDQVTVADTLSATGGTGAVVGYSVFKTEDDTPHSTVYSEDANGDINITGLESGVDYYIIAFTQTTDTADDFHAERVSVGAAPVFFTTT